MGMKYHSSGSSSKGIFLWDSFSVIFLIAGIIPFEMTFPFLHSHRVSLSGKVSSMQQNNMVLMGLLTA